MMTIDLGLIDFKEFVRTQKEIVEKRRAGKFDDCLLLAEHPSVFTLGRTGKRANLLVSETELQKCGIDFLQLDRGGDITYHGPGQLMLYPIISLKEKGLDLHTYMRMLEEVVIRVLSDYDVSGERIPGKTGVWFRGEKIASIGIGASGWVTYHGLGFNVNTDTLYFSMMNPCGMDDVKMTTLEKIGGRRIGMAAIKKLVATHFWKVFSFDSAREEPALAQ